MINVLLSRPLQTKAGEVTSLTFRDPEMGDLIAGEAVGNGNQTATVLATLASMAGITYPEAKKIAPRDFLRINEATAHLLGNDVPATGEA